MSNSTRVGLVVAAVVVIVAGFVLANGTSKDADNPERAATGLGSTTSAPVTTPSTVGDGANETTASAPQSPAKPAAPAIETIVVRDGAPRGGVQRLRFDKGDRVRFRVRSDTADEVHVHGYDVTRDVAAGGLVTFSFRASIDGRFEVELEQRGVEIAQLEVQP